jgi:CRISPR/Cas system CSM-associated protein Csm4 (group 5 of RAMP superfamily)
MNNYPQFSQTQMQFNPYMQRMENLQQFQQALQQPTVTSQVPALGKVVESMDIVKVTDIPMDGNVYYFPKADGEEIYTKQFLPNGQTRILTFKPFENAEPNNSADKDLKSQISLSDELTEAFMKRFDDLEMQMKEILSKSATKNTTSRSKKEVAEDE